MLMMDGMGNGNCPSHAMADNENLSMPMFITHFIEKCLKIVNIVREPFDIASYAF